MFCQKCGASIPDGQTVCPTCNEPIATGTQQQPPQIIINNANTNTNTAVAAAVAAAGVSMHRRAKNKWVAFFLCLFLGPFGAHKFYENKAGTGILYLCTAGLFLVGWIIDLINLLGKPNPYYVY